MRSRVVLKIALVLFVVGAAIAPVVFTFEGSSFQPTAAAAVDPRAIAENYVRQNLAQLGLIESDISDWVISDAYVTQHNGVTHVYFQQRLAGIQVLTGILNTNVTRDGRVFGVGNRFIPHLAETANTTVPQITAAQAIVAAASNLGLATAGVPLTILQPPTGPDQQVVFAKNALSMVPIKARLRFFPVRGGARLVWDVQIQPDSNHYWHVEVDAVDGSVIRKFNLVENDSYKVYEWPAESPNHVRSLPLPPGDGRTVATGSAASLLASPFGWHDTNGLVGADTADTTGNNVATQTDETNDDVYVAALGEVRPSNVARNFIYPIDLTKDPDTYREAVVTNLFYWNNVIHDLHYLFGFNEAAGNFQQNNYGKGGQGNDRLDADAQDGSGTNNANMLTLPEGVSPRMQMYIWTGATTLQVNSPSGIAANYPAAGAAFGGEITAAGITGDVQIINSPGNPGPQGEQPDQGCFPAPASLTGKIALIRRGGCEFGQKVVSAQNSGAIAVIIYNNAGNDLLLMGPGNTGAAATIPAIAIGQSHGELIRNTITGPPAATVNATMKKSAPDRDSDLDNAVIIHEYTHGVSNRLTGGPNSPTVCLESVEQGGEGWSDWFAMAFTARTGDTGPLPRGMGTYVTFQDPPTFGGGIRAFPYSTSMSVNPQTYNSIRTAAIPHGVGAVWAGMLWEMYWNIIDGIPELNLPGRGYRQDLYDLSQPLAGNQIALRLVMDGMKIQPCNPTFVDQRDAILEADQVNNGGAFQCHIWKAFAKRGLGVNAVDGGTFPLDDNAAVQEDFTVPCECAESLTNFASSALGSIATATNQHASGLYPASGAINGNRTASDWGNGGGWNDGSRGLYPDELEVNFGLARTLNQVRVYTLPNNWQSGSEPTLETSASGEGILDFKVEYWNGSAWVQVPGANVTGNDKAVRVFTFDDIVTTKIRIVVTASRNNWSRIVEVEAFGCN